jgi:hypothetical protein
MATTADILRGTADLLDELPYYRINGTDLHRALYRAAGSYRAAQYALTALRQATRGQACPLRSSDTALRSQAVKQLRDAAATVTR